MTTTRDYIMAKYPRRPVPPRLQCKHIPDERVIRAILETPGTFGVGEILDNWRDRFKVHEALNRQMSFEVPFKLFWKKIRLMSQRNLIDACCTSDMKHPCRGRIHLASECRDNNGGICGA